MKKIIIELVLLIFLISSCSNKEIIGVVEKMNVQDSLYNTSTVIFNKYESVNIKLENNEIIVAECDSNIYKKLKKGLKVRIEPQTTSDNWKIAEIIYFSGKNRNSAVNIKADQKNSKVIIDGNEVGSTPFDTILYEGSYIIEVFNESSNGKYYNYGLLTVEDDLPKSMSFSLELNSGLFIDSRDGLIYKTIKIGNQVWMAENLAYLPQVCESEDSCGYWVYDYNQRNVKKAVANKNYNTKGVLYNWKTANESCPEGWHLPSDEEWKTLEIMLGMKKADADNNAFRGKEVTGSKLKSTIAWNSCNGTNESGFNAVPCGIRLNEDGSFSRADELVQWWTSTTTKKGVYSVIWCRSLSCTNGIYREGRADWFKNGYSIRCVQDSAE